MPTWRALDSPDATSTTNRYAARAAGLIGTGDGPAGPAGPAVRFGDAALSRGQLWSAATAVADEVAGARSVALLGSASLPTVVGIVGCLLAGVPVVPVPADAGPRERAHILTDSGAEL
jgi:fatty acid CoA ligase FadD36